MVIHTTAIAGELLAKNILSSLTFTLKQLFEIRDSLYILDKYNLADINLLREVEKYLGQKAGE